MTQNRICYLDYNATTPVAPEVRQASDPFLAEFYGNASSPHQMGDRALRAVTEAREQVARWIGASPKEIIFTSGATESNNTAIQSALLNDQKKMRIVTSAVEHSSVKSLVRNLEKQGRANVVSIQVNGRGELNLAELERELTFETAVLSLMWVNNETGVIFPIEKIAQLAKSKGILFHVDAAQAAGKIPIDLSQVPIDFLSLSAHKFYGPKGVGILYVRKETPFHPLIMGGHQERERRAGTLNVPGIVGMGKACEWTAANFSEKTRDILKLRNSLEAELLEKIPGSFVNGRESERVFNTVNLTIPGVSAEVLLGRLDEIGICASSGAACMSGALLPSHVLLATGLSEEEALSSFRFSLGFMTTEEEIRVAVERIPALVREIRRVQSEEVMNHAKS